MRDGKTATKLVPVIFRRFFWLAGIHRRCNAARRAPYSLSSFFFKKLLLSRVRLNLRSLPIGCRVATFQSTTLSRIVEILHSKHPFVKYIGLHPHQIRHHLCCHGSCHCTTLPSTLDQHRQHNPISWIVSLRHYHAYPSMRFILFSSMLSGSRFAIDFSSVIK